MDNGIYKLIRLHASQIKLSSEVNPKLALHPIAPCDIERRLGQCRSGHKCAVCLERNNHVLRFLARVIRAVNIREPRQQFYA